MITFLLQRPPIDFYWHFSYFSGSKVAKPWNYSPKALRKATCGFVGLLNLGATCYMNSVLQQIFMVPQFRRGLLSCEVENQGVGDENTQILYQLQRIFSYLQVCCWFIHGLVFFFESLELKLGKLRHSPQRCRRARK